MKIGILAYRQNPYISANTSIAYTIGKHISKNTEHQIVYIGRLQDECQRKVNEYEDIPICYFNKNPKNSSGKITNYARKLFSESIGYSEEARCLKKIVAEQGIDALVCVIAPADDLYIVSKAKLDVPVILYQLDPFFSVNDVVSSKLRHSFINMISGSSITHIFTTELLYEEYKNDEGFEELISKISVLGFPKLKSWDLYEKSNKNNEKTKLLYAGSLYNGIRSPMILAEFSKCLTDNAELVFCGGCDSPQDIELLKNAGVICKGYLNQTELAKEYASADVLVNIGNSVKNQLGSKLIDYIASGKPIVNIYQIDKCPTVPVLEKYQFKINIKADELKSENSKQTINNFVVESRGERIPFNEIEKLYEEYTPEFVCGCLLNKLV